MCAWCWCCGDNGACSGDRPRIEIKLGEVTRRPGYLEVVPHLIPGTRKETRRGRLDPIVSVASGLIRPDPGMDRRESVQARRDIDRDFSADFLV